jgi:hypothetical protein
MDWSKVRSPPAPRPDPPQAPRHATLFRVQGASGRALRCATYRVVTGFELRLEYEDRDDDLLRSQLFKTLEEEEIAEVASRWHAVLEEKGFTELPLLRGVTP